MVQSWSREAWRKVSITVLGTRRYEAASFIWPVVIYMPLARDERCAGRLDERKSGLIVIAEDISCVAGHN